MQYIRLIFECFTYCLLNVNFQELYLPLIAFGIVGFTVLTIKRRVFGYV